jgi:hypothetical protein
MVSYLCPSSVRVVATFSGTVLFLRIIHKLHISLARLIVPLSSSPLQILTFRSNPSADSVLVIVTIVVTTDNNNIITISFNKTNVITAFNIENPPAV